MYISHIHVYSNGTLREENNYTDTSSDKLGRLYIAIADIAMKRKSQESLPWFYSIPTIVGYLMPNTFSYIKTVLF